MANPFIKQAPATQMPTTDMGVEGIDLQRAYRMADMLRQQADAPIEGAGMVGQVYVPSSWTQGLAHVARQFAASNAEDKANNLAKQTAQDYQTKLADTLRRSQELAAGTPEKTYALPDDQAGPRGVEPAVPGNRQAAAMELFKHPATQQLGMSQLQNIQNQMQLRELLGGFGGQPGTGQGGTAGGLPGLPGVNPTAAALAFSGLPGAKEVAGWVQEGEKPVALREGDLIRRNADGSYFAAYSAPKLPPGMEAVRDNTGKVIGTRVIPGFTEGQSSITNANEQAKARYEPITVGENVMTKEQFSKASGGTPSQSGWQVPPDVQAKRDQTAGQIRVDEGATQANLAEIDKELANKNLNSTTRGVLERERKLIALGLSQQGQPQQPGQQQQPGIKIKGESEKEFEKSQGKYFSDTYSNLQNGAMTATKNIANLERMSNLLNGMDTGKLSPTKAQIAALGESLGIKIDKGLGEKQALEALSNEMALALRNPSNGAGMPGAMSDADREYLKAMVPSLSRTPEGNRIMIDAAMKMEKRNQEVAALARDYVQRKGMLDNGFYQELQTFSNTNPLFKSNAVSKAPAATNAPTVDVNALVEMYSKKR